MTTEHKTSGKTGVDEALIFFDSNTAHVIDVHFKEWQEVVSTIGGLSTSLVGVLTIFFSILIYNEWEYSLLNSVLEKSIEDEIINRE